MPRFLDTTGNSSIAIFICDRCKMKRAISEQMPDPNFPGLRVCQQNCADEKDPYRLPARKTERINLRYPRPDVPLPVPNNQLITGPTENYVLSTGLNTSAPGLVNGNEDELVIGP